MLYLPRNQNSTYDYIVVGFHSNYCLYFPQNKLLFVLVVIHAIDLLSN